METKFAIHWMEMGRKMWKPQTGEYFTIVNGKLLRTNIYSGKSSDSSILPFSDNWKEYKPEPKYVTYDVAFKAARETGCSIRPKGCANTYMKFQYSNLKTFYQDICEGYTKFHENYMDGECWEILEDEKRC